MNNKKNKLHGLFFFAILIISNVCFSQNPSSNEKIIKEIDILNSLSIDSIGTSLKATLNFSTKALRLCNTLNYKNGLFKALCNQTQAYIYLGNKKEALNNLIAIKDIAFQLKDNACKAECFKLYSQIYEIWDDPHEAIQYRLESLRYFLLTGNEHEIIESYFSIANIQLEKGEYELAFDYYTRALIFSLVNVNSNQILRVLSEISRELIVLNQGAPARGLLEICKFIERTQKVSFLLKFSIKSIEAFYEEKINKNFGKSIQLYLSSIYPTDSLEPTSVGITYSRIAHQFFMMKEYKNSLQYNFKSLQSRIACGHVFLIGSSLTNIGYDYFQMQQYDSALYYFNKSLEVCKIHQREKYLANNYEKLYMLYKIIHKSDIALQFLEKFAKLNEHLIKKAKKLDLEKTQSKLEVEKKEKQLIAAKLENQQYLYFIIIIISLAIIVTIIVIGSYKSISEKKIRKLYIDLEKKYNQTINQLQEKIIESKINLDNLILSEEKFRVLFEKNPIGIVTISLETQKILNANSSFCNMLEYDLQELTNFTFNNLTHPDEVLEDFPNQIQEEVWPGKSATIDIRYLTKNGNTIWVSLTRSIVYDVSKNPIYGLAILQNITEKRNVEKYLIESEEKLRLLIDYSPIVIAMLDMDMRYLIVNEAFYKEFNIQSNIIGKTVMEVFPNTPPEVFEMYSKAIKGESFSKAETEFTFVTGKELWFNWNLFPWYQYQGVQSGIVQYAVNITQRKIYETQLNHNVYLQNTIFQSIPSSVLIFDAQSFKVTWATTNFYESFGMDQNEYEQTYHSDLFSPIFEEDAIIVRKAIDKLIKQKTENPVSFEFRRQHKNGEWLWFLSKAVIFKRNDNGEVKEILSSSLEITERKQIEIALSASELKYKVQIEQAADAIFFGNPEGIFIDVNQQAVELTAYSREELIGMSMSHLFPKEQLEQKPLDYDAVRSGLTVLNERNLKRKDGKIIPIEMNTKMLSDGTYQAIFHDITDLKATEIKIRENESKLNEAQRIAKMGSFSFDFVTNTLDYSENIFDILNLSKPKGEVILSQRSILKNIHPEDIHSLSIFRKSQIIQKKNQFKYEFRVIDSNGNTKYVEMASQLYYNIDGKLIKQISTIVDVSERKLTEIQIRKAFESERELNKMKTNFVSMVSHEFRNPLAAISSSNELLNLYLNKINLDETQKRKSQNQISKINNEIKRLSLLIENVLTINKEESGKLKFNPEFVILNEFIPKSLEEIQQNIFDEREVEFKYFGIPMSIKIDKNLFHYILNNLVSNAFKFSIGKPAPQLLLIFTETMIHLEMKDFGIGIPLEDQKYLFSTFYRAKNATLVQGSGLGLVLIKHFVELHNGKIQIQSEVDKGTTFTITLPIEKNE